MGVVFVLGVFSRGCCFLFGLGFGCWFWLCELAESGLLSVRLRALSLLRCWSPSLGLLVLRVAGLAVVVARLLFVGLLLVGRFLFLLLSSSLCGALASLFSLIAIAR